MRTIDIMRIVVVMYNRNRRIENLYRNREERSNGKRDKVLEG